MGRKISRSRKRGKLKLSSEEEGNSVVDSSSRSEQDDSEDEDFKAYGFEDLDDDEEEVAQSDAGSTVKRKRGLSKGMATKTKVTTKEPMKTEKRGVVEKVTLHTRVFTDNSLTKGGEVKEARGVLKVLHREFKGRTATINCKVEAFGRILHRFDNRRKQWVCELGFGGLYHLCGKNLPRNFVYWLMTRVDPVNQLFRGTNGVDVPMNKNQVRWILGLPKGEKVIPTNEGDADEQMKIAAQNVLRLYGRKWQSVNPRKRSDMIYTDAIPVNPKFLERLEGEWGENDEQEFKTMFLIAALAMVLCPTQCGRLSAGTIYACTLGMQSSQYDWCKLVYDFFIEMAKVFCRDFYTYGWTKGVGGCTMYLVILYLDRLGRIPVQWGVFPRLKAWDMKEILEAKRADRESGKKGDYGVLECVVVAYGETQHPRATKDSHGPVEEVYIPVMDNEILTLKPRKKGNSERNPMKMRQMAKERAKENSIELERIELDMETVNEEPIITPPPPRT
ncbi:uncharacterized protein [Spinacia oleracea]|nr:uncharacterized protein LOC110791790 isoform X2 [Spinacia oleracea]XP_056692940.1 uncharacterized protein LOC110791790 isoform X2 [Spinacia oleracea]